MKINIVCVGKMKEDFLKGAQAEYAKMLRRFCTLNIVELADEPDSAGAKAARSREGERILPRLEGCVISCDIRGKKMSSEDFAGKLQSFMLDGVSTVTFVIGGSNGIADEVLEKSRLRLSFSDMTLPHRLFRIVLLEQVYRAFKIINRESYHK